jgi:putative exporter of polyketide antibiotics
MTDRLIAVTFAPEPWLVHLVEVTMAAGVIAVALLLRRKKHKQSPIAH